MSDIPLHTFGRYRKSRAGYSALPEDDEHPGNDQADRSMPISVRVAAASARKAKRNVGQYEGDAEEEATLLGGHHESELE